jgi:ribosomal-protein-alanine N-acetyltransferase
VYRSDTALSRYHGVPGDSEPLANRGWDRVRSAVYVIDEMTVDDIEEVSAVETRSFPSAWPISAYRRELRNRRQSFYVVLRDDPVIAAITTTPRRLPEEEDDGGRIPVLPVLRRGTVPRRMPILGFAGMWVLLDEAHVTTIGVDPDQQGRGLGEFLFVTLIDEAMQRGAIWVTLEVRVTNHTAQSLYRKYGFTVQGRRPRYYSDNNEDAFIMWSESLRDPGYRRRLEELRRGALHRLGGGVGLELAE